MLAPSPGSPSVFHFAHEFGLVTPFFEVGLANSVPDTRFLHRPYTSLGKLAHFEGGSELDLGDKFSVSASGYYILPWGPQQSLEPGGFERWLQPQCV